MDEKPQSYAEWLREPDASWPKERLRRSQQAHQNALYVENLALTPTTTVREMQPYGERVGIKVRSKKDFAAVHQAHRELAAEAEGRALESYPHLASTRNYKPKMSAPAQKSEPRAATLARGILAAVELRKAHYGTGRGKYPRPWKDKQSGRMHQDLTHLLPEQYHATHSMEASWLPGMPQHVSAKVTYKHPSYGTSEALGFTSHGGSKEWYEGSGAASQHSKAHEIQPHADAAFGRFLQSKMMAPHHPDRE